MGLGEVPRRPKFVACASASLSRACLADSFYLAVVDAWVRQSSSSADRARPSFSSSGLGADQSKREI